jgi:hypothetical protein
MPRHRGLAVIGEHFDHAFIYEYSQRQVFSLFNSKGGLIYPTFKALLALPEEIVKPLR